MQAEFAPKVVCCLAAPSAQGAGPPPQESGADLGVAVAGKEGKAGGRRAVPSGRCPVYHFPPWPLLDPVGQYMEPKRQVVPFTLARAMTQWRSVLIQSTSRQIELCK